MTPDVARIAYGMALLPLLFGIWWMSIVLLPEIVSAQNSPWPEYLSLELVTLVAVIVWVLVWRTRVEWTPSRRLGTWVLALVLLAAPAQQFLPTDVFSDGSLQLMIRIARASTWLFVLGLWFMGTAWLWRMRNDSSVHTNQRPEVRCPQCDYSLTGLCEVRCPECNWSSTIDEIARLALDSAASA